MYWVLDPGKKKGYFFNSDSVLSKLQIKKEKSKNSLAQTPHILIVIMKKDKKKIHQNTQENFKIRYPNKKKRVILGDD